MHASFVYLRMSVLLRGIMQRELILGFAIYITLDPPLPGVHALGGGDHLHRAAEVRLHAHAATAGTHHAPPPVRLLPHPAVGEARPGVQADAGRLGLLRAAAQRR